ncbi:unnamed protein product [Pocillopora meandrina]|uniref:FYVE, RhoGEF and PH domain-containing protein 6 n=1 Tax=Pocillopora meandrina TaxID=46732 RepID=A0AAU9X4G1_9CNID|nr:unnamed protein product [Pocillopora meandrina]
MSVKEKAKAFEGRSSVIGESPPPKKKSREEHIGKTLESSSETPEPPPRKSKKNGKIKSSEEYSPSLERKENIPTSVKDTKGRQKPPRPPPPPRGSSLGRKSELLSNLRLQSSGEKKKKPPVPPKPKNHIPKKAYVKRNISVKSVKKIVSQPAKDGSVLVPKSSTNSAHESQFFAPLDKDTSKVASSENHESKRSSQFFVSLEEQTSSKDSLNTKELDNSKGHIVFEHASEDSEFSNVENGFVDSNGIHENGVASRPLVIQPGNINFEKDMADPLEGLEITVDYISEDDDISSMLPEGKNEVGEFSEPMEVSVDDASNDRVCNEFQPVDGVEEPEDKVHILYSVELEEECSVTVIENDTRSDEKGKKILEVQGEIRAENNEVIEVGKGESIASNLLSENLVGENASLTNDEVEKDKMEEEISVVNFFNHQEEMASNFEAEERVDSVLENLSEDSEEIVMKEDSPVDEVQELSVNQNVECETELESSQICVDSTGQNKVENVTDKSHEAAMEEAQQNESQQNGEVIMAEPIREGTLLSVTDRVIFKEISHVDEDKNNSEEPAEEKLEDVRNEDHSGFKGQHENEGFMEKNELEFVFTKPEELESCQDMAVELDKTEQSGEQLLENSIPENFCQEERKDGQTEFACTSGNEEEPKIEEDVSSLENTEVNVEQAASQENVEAVLFEMKEDQDKSTVNAIPNLKEDIETASSEFVGVEQPPSKANKEVVQVEVEEVESSCIVNAISISTEEDLETASSEFPVPPERRSRKAKKQKHVYENIAATSRQLEQIKIKGDSLRKTQSFSKYETASLSISRPVQRVSDDEVIYRVPAKVIPVESFRTDESEYSVPLPISSRARSVTMQDEYAVPKSIIVKACAVTDSHCADDREIYSVPGQVTPVPVVEKFSDFSSRLPSQAVPQEDDSEYAVPVQAKPAMSAPVSATPPPKPPRTSLLKEEFNVFASVEETSSSASTESETRQSPKPVPRTRELKNSPSPVPRKSSKTAASSESSTTHSSENSPSPVPRKNSKLVMSTDSSSTNSGDNSPTPVPRKSLKIASSTESTSTQSSESPVPVPRTRLNALQPEPSISNESSSELSTLSSSDISTVETTEEEQTLKRKPPPRPPPPSSRTSIINNENEAPPLTPGPFANEADSDTDSDVGEEASSKGPPKSKTYYIAHEILSTEQTFVDALKLVFEECYGTIKQANVVADSTLGDIFCDLENIYLLDSRFLQELEERMKTWEEHERIGDIIKKYSHFLKMYTQFVNGYDKAIGVFQDTMKENSEFADMVAKFQASERCHGMALSSYMLKPVQRIPSYRLLLIDYLKHLPKDSEESKDIEAALKIVSEVATHINESMKKMENFEQMLKVQRSLVGHPEIVKAGRDFIKEGTLMKLCRKDMQERMFFLLTDVLLYTTPVGGNQYKLNKTLPLLGMQVTVPDSPDFVNEFSIISTTRSFTLTASTPEERDQWVETLNNAIDVVTKRKITFFNKTRDATGLGVQERDEEVMKLGEKAPVWIPDHRVTMCMSCTSPFTLTNRRHHCRACGNVVCGACSESTAPLAYLEYNQARVCDKCYDLLLKDFHTVEMKAVEEESPTSTLPPLLQEAEDAEKLLRKPTKFEMMRRFKSRKTKRKSTIMHPSHLTEVVANQEGSQMSGYLKYKKGKFGWKKSWFVLKDNVLYSYKASSDVVALESQPVLSYEIEDLGKEGNDFVFQLKHHGISPLVFKADNENSATRWIRELKKATTMQS